MRRPMKFFGRYLRQHRLAILLFILSWGLLAAGFEITGLVEPQPEAALLDTVPGMRDELRRPMMLILSAVRKQA